MFRTTLLAALIGAVALTAWAQPAYQQPQQSQQRQVMSFQRIWEPNQHAFQITIPAGWSFQGGTRSPEPVGGVGQMLTPKTNFTVTSPDGQVGLQWFEEIMMYSFGPNPPPAAPMLMQQGHYNGMPLVTAMDAATAIEQLLIPYQRQGYGMQVTERRPLPSVGQVYAQNLPHAMASALGGSISADAGLVTATNGQHDERYLAICVYSQMPGGDVIWSNPVTCSWWAPAGQLSQWEPLLGMVFESVEINAEWLRNEMMRNAHTAQQISQVQQECARIDWEIANHRSQTNAEIARMGQLNLMGMHDRLDPATGNRTPVPNWANSAHIDPSTGQMIVSNDPHYNPNDDPNVSGNFTPMPTP
ncbi:hypothetical protein JXA47_13720 [Candidatus Sumerlaeota bacterium]|nr:hypothetical protein [Candidatus Sumerlaeota bacterium]